MARVVETPWDCKKIITSLMARCSSHDLMMLSHPLLADAQHVEQPLRVVVDDVQRLVAKAVDDAFGHDLAHAANHAGAEVALDAFGGGGQGLFAQFHLELTAVFGVGHPFAGQLQPFARVHFRQIAHDGDERVAARGVFETAACPACLA